MHSFFEKLPEEITLKIAKNLTIEDQIRLARVDKFFNKLTQDQSLELTKHKETATKHSIGNACLILAESRGWRKATAPYSLFLTRNGKEVFDSGMHVFDKSYNEIKEALKGDSQSLINKLKKMGGTAQKSVKVLEEELQEIERIKILNRANLPSLKLFSARSIVLNSLNRDSLNNDCKSILRDYEHNGDYKRFIGIGN